MVGILNLYTVQDDCDCHRQCLVSFYVNPLLVDPTSIVATTAAEEEPMRCYKTEMIAFPLLSNRVSLILSPLVCQTRPFIISSHRNEEPIHPVGKSPTMKKKIK
jgi:hypothetical protein